MRTIRIKAYKFNELSKEAKETAIQVFSDLNVNEDWWNWTYEDAANIGLKITSFDTDRPNYCNGDFTESGPEVARLILSSHGVECETYKTAKEFLTDYDLLVEKYSDGITKNIVAEDNEYEFDSEADDLEDDFRKSLLEDYLILLRHEYEYLISDEAIIETIQLNDYEFTKEGKLI